MEKLKEKLSQILTGRILDIGTGRGEFVSILKENLQGYTEIVGIDQTDRAIKYCEEKFKTEDNIHFKKMNGEKIDFKNGTFDMVCISNTIHHLKNRDLILNEMKRVLKPNGLFVINEMFRDHQTDEQLSHVKIHHFGAKIDSLLGIYHGSTFTRNQLIDIPKQLRLGDVDMFDYRFVAENSMEKDTIDYLVEVCDKMLERIKEKDEYETLKLEAKEIQTWIKNNGFQGATELMIVGINKQ